MIISQKKLCIIKALFCIQTIVSMIFPLLKIPHRWSIITISGCITMVVVYFMIFGNKNIWGTIKTVFTKYDKKLLVPLMVLAISFIGWGCYYKELVFLEIGFIYMVGVPICQWMIKQEKKLLDMLCEGVVLAFWILTVATVLVGPGLTPQYGALYGNPNLLGFFCMATNTAALYLYRTQGKRRYLIAILVGLSLGMLSMSRTFFLIVVIQFAFGIFLTRKKGSLKKEILPALKKLGMLVICFSIVLVSLTFGKALINKALPKIQLIDQESDLNIDHYLNISAEKAEQGSNGSIDDLTSGRTMIWKVYIENIGMKGHPDIQLRAHDEKRYYAAARAHNAVLEVAFYTGIVGGIAFVAYFLLFGIKILKQALQRKKMKTVMPIFLLMTDSCIGFVIVNMTATCYEPFAYLIATMFWLASGLAVFDKSIED